MKKLLPLALVFAANTATATNSVDLRVTGTITPAACNISLPGDGTIDFDVIHTNKEIETALPKKTTPLSITCSGSTLIGIKATDNQQGTAADGGSSGYPHPQGSDIYPVQICDSVEARHASTVIHCR